jgi:mycobactin peptide synthetase MbtE
LADMRTRDPYEFGDRIERVVAFHARHDPDAIAVQQGADTVAYADLVTRASAVASELRRRGASRGSYVPTLMARSPELVVALLGIMEAGAAYVALDLDWPQARIDDVVERCAPPLVLTDDDGPTEGGRAHYLPLGELLGHSAAAGPAAPTPSFGGAEAACVFFTSGSTGRPKGVVSPHTGTVRTLVNCPTVPLDRTTVLLQAAPLAWDGLSLELWGALLNGGRCILLDRDRHMVDAEALRTAIERGVNTLWLTSSLFNVFADEDAAVFEGVRVLMVGGERVSVPHVRAVLEALPDLHVVNGYGPAESTIFATSHVVRDKDLAPDVADIPIGKPVPRTGVALIAADGRPASPGEEGEIVVTGDGLALGYLADSEETTRRFFENTNAGLPPGRYYRTGDLAVLDDEHNLRFRGRTDRQFKLHGLRIEAGEIEAVLEEYPGIASCCVLRTEVAGSHPRLACVYTTVDGSPLDERAVRDFASRRLLGGMVPAALHHVARLPLFANGKVDHAAVRRLLAEREEQCSIRAGDPEKESDEPLLAEVRELLAIPSLLPKDDLFDAGVSSLGVVHLAERLSSRIGARVTMADVYRLRNVAAICAAARLSEKRRPLEAQSWRA